jgi:hypothetical protein
MLRRVILTSAGEPNDSEPKRSFSNFGTRYQSGKRTSPGKFANSSPYFYSTAGCRTLGSILSRTLFDDQAKALPTSFGSSGKSYKALLKNYNDRGFVVRPGRRVTTTSRILCQGFLSQRQILFIRVETVRRSRPFVVRRRASQAMTVPHVFERVHLHFYC